MDDIRYIFQNYPAASSDPQTLYIAITTPMDNTTQGVLAFASLITKNTTDANNHTNIELDSQNYTATYAYSSCLFNQTFLDVNITFQEGISSTYAVKPSAPPHPFLFSGNQTAIEFLNAAGVTTNGVATDTERYIMYEHVVGSDTGEPDRSLAIGFYSTPVPTLKHLLANRLWTH
jgi:hypothetical protein